MKSLAAFFWLFAFATLLCARLSAQSSLNITTFAGAAGAMGSTDSPNPRLTAPGGVACDSAGNVYVTEFNNVIRKITPAGVVTTLAGLANSPGGGADGIGDAARFNQPSAIAVDGAGNAYVADAGNHTIRKITPAGSVSTFAGLAGAVGGADGPGANARFHQPIGIALDSAGSLYVAESGNHTIRKITPAGDVSTLAGLTGVPGSADGVGGQARFNEPFGIAVDSAGNVFVSDSGNSTMRKISPLGNVTTLAGQAGAPSGGTDGAGKAARFYGLIGPAVDAAGNVFVADFFNNTIRKITPEGVVTTAAGLPGAGGSTNGVGSKARFNGPYGLAFDNNGNLFIADSANSIIRKGTFVTVAAPAITIQPKSTSTEFAGNAILQISVTGYDLSYQWFRGSTGDTSDPVPGATGPLLITPPLAAGASFWVRAINSVGSRDSRSASVTVAPPPRLTLRSLGSNAYGQLGDGTTTRRSFPFSVAANVTSVAAGNYHTLFVKSDGTLWSMGQNTSGQLGDGSTTDRLRAVQIATGVAQASGGNLHSVFLKYDGTVWAMGNNNGRLGDGTNIARIAPVQVAAGVAQISAGGLHSLLVKTDGTLWGTGFNLYGQLGDGTTTQRSSFVPVATEVTRVAGGFTHSLFAKLDGSLWSMGENDYGQLGDATLVNRSFPVQVATDVAAIDGDTTHTLFAKSDGTLWGMGDNTLGALGDGTNIRRPSPIPIATNVAHVAAGALHSLFSKTDGTLWAMGGNVDGQLGDGTFTLRRSPVQVAADATKVAAGFSHSLFLQAPAPGFAPTISGQPAPQTVAVGQTATFSVTATAAVTPAYQWRLNGVDIPGATQSSYNIIDAQPGNTGVYSVRVSMPGNDSIISADAQLSVTTQAKVVGTGTEIAADIHHPSGNIYDQILLTGAAATITADPGQITRISYIDLTNDIVQVEFSGPGALTITLENATGPALPEYYNQTVSYMKGHATLTVAGATASTHVSVFTVGTFTAVNQKLFKPEVRYDGVADIASLSIASADGRFGGVRLANTEFSGARGLVGLNAPGVAFAGPVNLHNLSAGDAATPVLLTGQIDTGRVGVTGGDMYQPNGQPVRVEAAQSIAMLAGATSHSVAQPVQINKAQYERNGQNVTDALTQGL